MCIRDSSDRDVADPWYTGDFDVTYEDVATGCEAFLEYLLDVLLFGETEEKAALITDYGKDVIQLEPVSYTHLDVYKRQWLFHFILDKQLPVSF